MENLLLAVSEFIINIVSDLGYLGIYLGMTIESASIPLPSEVIMGFAGYLVYKGELNLFLAALVGALGNITGSTIMYLLGSYSGPIIVKKWGKYLHITEKKYTKAKKWFQKYGNKTVFGAQLLPGFRTFISLPAGVLKIHYPTFILYTFLGALIWCFTLAWLALKFGENWENIKNYTHLLELGIIVAIIGIIVYLVLKYFRKANKKLKKDKNLLK